jgi:16S rRNA (guanine966-N2)-methyltransferase
VSKIRKSKQRIVTSSEKRQKSPILRVIGGEWRGRKLSFHTAAGLRPTSDRLRETLFNWLQWEISGSRCLDLFAGSGALGFEAASRGATSVVMVEINPASVLQLNHNREQLQAERVEVLHADAGNYLHSKPSAFDIVFVDPPFSQLEAGETCASLERQGVLLDGALIYVETPHKQKVQVPGGWSVFKSSRVGQVRATLYRRG